MGASARRALLRSAVALAILVPLVAAPAAQAGKLTVTSRTEWACCGGAVQYHDVSFWTPYSEANDVTVRAATGYSILFADAASPISIEMNSRYDNKSTGQQWFCMSLSSPGALCTWEPGAPSDCDVFGCGSQVGSQPGFDGIFISTGDKDDSVDAVDGERQRIVCGSGDDSVAADAIDVVGDDCEHVTRG